MAAITAAPAHGAEGTTVFVAPYPRSWIDRLTGLIHRAPVPAPVVYLALMVPSIVISNSANWASGLQPVGTFVFSQTFWGVWTVGFVWVLDYLSGVAESSFDAFRPAISPEAIDAERARYELSVIPARPALVMTILSVAFTLSYYAADPVASAIVGLSPVALAGRAMVESFSTALIINLMYQGFRQLRAVRRLYAAADRIDLFRPAPLHAFSKLTAQTGIALIAVVTFGYIGNPVPVDRESFVTLWLPWLVGFPAVALAIFLVPLLGMHQRLVSVKDELHGAADERLKSILAEVNRDVDARDLSRADGLNKTLASLLQQREVVSKLPTWPWSVGTIRGFASALLLPLVVFLLQRVVAAALP